MALIPVIAVSLLNITADGKPHFETFDLEIISQQLSYLRVVNYLAFCLPDSI